MASLGLVNYCSYVRTHLILILWHFSWDFNCCNFSRHMNPDRPSTSHFTIILKQPTMFATNARHTIFPTDMSDTMVLVEVLERL